MEREKYDQIKCKEKREREQEGRHKPFDAIHRRERISGRGGQKTSSNREHENLPSLSAVGILCFWSSGYVRGGVEVWDRRSHRERCGF